MTPPQKKSQRKSHKFGGEWTTVKLNIIANYLASYATALQNKPSEGHPFKKAYIDAFAGSGYREMEFKDTADSQSLLFPDLTEIESQALLEGSTTQALRTQPPFDRYIFIEKKAKYCAYLQDPKKEFPKLASRISINKGDANAEIQEICRKNWSAHRAVLFLDPYGMQVDDCLA